VLDRAAVEGVSSERLTAVLAQGVDLVQLREREVPGGALLSLARGLREAVRRAGGAIALVVNRRADVALAAGADGVHLGFDGLAPRDARELLGPAAWVGVSCHAPAEVAAAEGASYAHLAPIFEPLSKPAARAPLGAPALAACAGRPVLAQGGITADNAGACLAAGAAGVAVTGAIWNAADPAAAAARLRRALDAAVPRGR
jgi:thiamine-phosphate diphosphorylase